MKHQKSHNPWTEEQDRALIVDVDKGKSIALLAVIHKRTERAIRQRLQRILDEQKPTA